MSFIALTVRKFRVFAAAFRLWMVVYQLCFPVCSCFDKIPCITSARVGGSVFAASSFSQFCSLDMRALSCRKR